MTNKNQVGETAWFYSHSHKRALECEIKGFSWSGNWKYIHVRCAEFADDDFRLDKYDLYDTKAEAVEATRAWAENGINILQTILDDLKNDKDQMD